MTLATTSAAVILWPSAIVVSPLIDSLVEPTSLDAAVAGFFSGLLAARYTTSTDVTRRKPRLSRAFAECRRRDSNPRHADYDWRPGGLIWLRRAICLLV